MPAINEKHMEEITNLRIIGITWKEIAADFGERKLTMPSGNKITISNLCTLYNRYLVGKTVGKVNAMSEVRVNDL